jgi:eukaryotic-like serine/threonine-protein kinase
MHDDSAILGQLVEEYTARLRQGERPEIEEYARRQPALAERIRQLFPTLMLLEGLAGGGTSDGREAPEVFAAGTMFGPYRILRELGRGGMGIVHEAEHQTLHRHVALKILPVAGPQAAKHLERFFREAKTAAGLHHTNIVPVFDVGQVGGVPFYAMQYIPGRSLDRIIKGDAVSSPAPSTPLGDTGSYHPEVGSAPPIAPTTTDGNGGRSPPYTPPADHFRLVAEIGIQAAAGLAYAHQRGVIHRDIKPSNLLLDEQGTVWITDFGLARRLDDVTLTNPGQLLGTPRYMSPEQAEAAVKPLDHRTDLYSLGATLYELLTRRPAFDGQTPQEVVTQIISRDPISPRKLDPKVPRDLETIILKAMAKRPVDRYATAADLGDDLRRFLNNEPIRARRISLVGRTWRWCKRNPVVAGLISAVVTILLTATAITTTLALFALSERDRADHKAKQLERAHNDLERTVARSFLRPFEAVPGTVTAPM